MVASVFSPGPALIAGGENVDEFVLLVIDWGRRAEPHCRMPSVLPTRYTAAP